MRRLAALLPLLVATSAIADPGPIARSGEPVVARIVRPGTGPSLPGDDREIGIGLERGEAEFRALKHPRPEPSRLGGRELLADTNLDPPRNANAGFAGLPQYFSIPYDAAIAVGRTQVLVMTNNQFGVYDRVTGARRATALFNDFFGAAAGGGYDPKCLYDAAADRFVMVVLEWTTNPNRAQIDLAVSKSGDATGQWFHYIYDAKMVGTTATETWADYSGLGDDDLHLYLTTNQFHFSGRYRFSRLRAWSKAELYSGVAARWVDFAPLRHDDGALAFAIKPARTLSPTRAGRLVATRPDGGSSVSTWIVRGTFPDLTLGIPRTVSVGRYRVGPDARQPGSSIRIDTGDCRAQDAVWRDGHLFTSFTEKRGAGNRAVTAVRYLDINDNGAALRDVTYFADGHWLFYPAVSADANGNVAMVFGRSSAAEYASIYQTRMPAGGRFESSRRLSGGVAPHTRQRWGDYNAVANDPADPSRIWLYGGYGVTRDRWATWIAALDPSVPGAEPALLALDDGEAAPDSSVDLAIELRVLRLGARDVRFAFEISEPGDARLELFDVAGRRVIRLLDRPLDAGAHFTDWDGRLTNGARAASGSYWARLTTPAGARTLRVTLE